MVKSRTSPGVEEAAREAYGSALQVAPSALSGKTANEPEVVRWVARNIDNPNPDPASCPDPFAWTLLRQCRENPQFVPFFVEKLWSKLIPSRSQLEDGGPSSSFDGRVTVELIRRLRELGRRVEQSAARRFHAPEVAGSSPAPATIPDAFSEIQGEPDE